MNPHIPSKVSKGAKIRNRYNQVPHLTTDTNGKVTHSHLDTTNDSQEVSPFPPGDNYKSIVVHSVSIVASIYCWGFSLWSKLCYHIIIGLLPLKRILSNVPGNYELRIDLEDWDGETRYAQYSLFDIGGPEDNYKLDVFGYTGNAGDISEKLIPGCMIFLHPQLK